MSSVFRFRMWHFWAVFILFLAGILYISLKNQPKDISSMTFERMEEEEPLEFSVQLQQSLALLQSGELTEEQLETIYQFIQRSRRNPSSYSLSRELRQAMDSLEKLHADKTVTGELQHSQEAEAAGMKALEAGHYEEAIARLEEAITIQTRVNNRYQVSPPRDHSRVVRMESQIVRARVTPWVQKSEEIESRASAALEEKRYDEAAPLYREAAALQVQINQQFRTTRYADYHRAQQLQDKQKLSEAGALYQTGIRWIHAAEKSAIEGDVERATLMYNEAERELLKLIENYPANPFVSRASLGNMLRNREDLEAFPHAAKVLSAVKEIRQALRQDDLKQVQERISTVHGEMESFFSRYPQSTLVSSEDRYQIQYLLNAQSRLVPLRQRMAGQNLLTVEDGIKWSAQPVSLQLYQEVMRRGGASTTAAAPATGVAYTEVKEFCMRLSAISGYKVRLPSVAEYEGLSEPLQQEGRTEQWAEWTWDENGAAVVYPFREFSVNRIPVTTRSNELGFRYLIEPTN